MKAYDDSPLFKDGHLITVTDLITTQMIRRLPFLERTVIRLNQSQEIVDLDTHFLRMPWITALVMRNSRTPLFELAENLAHSFSTGYVQHFVNVLHKCTNLEQLVIRDDAFLPYRLDDLQANSLPKLKKLVIVSGILTTALLQQFLRAAPNLESLYLGESILREENLFIGLAPGSLRQLFQFWAKAWRENQEDWCALKKAAPKVIHYYVT